MPLSRTETHCPYCALQCGMVLRAQNGNGDGLRYGDSDRSPMVSVEPRDLPTSNGGPTTKGGLCQKGWTAAELLDPARRLTTPLARPHPAAPLASVSWEEAIGRVADAVRQVQAVHGRDAVGVFGGGGLTNEKAYTLGKFARAVLRTSTIDYNGRFCMSSAAAASSRAFGIDRGLPFPLGDIARTATLMLVGSNVAETMPPFLRYVTAQQQAGGALVVVDPRRTPTAAMATLHLQPAPGTDLALANGLLHLAITEQYVDHAYVDARTTGFEAVRAAVAEFWPERVERVTGVPVAQQRAAVRLIGEAETAMVLTARGAEQHSHGTDTVTALVNLALALGLPGRPGSGFGTLTGQGNGQGGREHGQKADQLPGYRSLTDPQARAHVAGVWGIDPGLLPGPGPSAYEMLDRLGTPRGAQALLVFGSNPVVSAPRAAHVQKRLAQLRFLVVADLVLSETAQMADVVLPTAQWAEEEGTTTNLEGRVLRRRPALDPPSGVRSDLQILASLAERLDSPVRLDHEPAEVFAELRRASAGGPADYSGITYERLTAEDGVFWPCPSEDHPGTPRMFLDSFPTPTGRARFLPVTHRPAAEPLDDEYPFHLTTGRVLAHYQSGAQTRRVPSLSDAEPEPFVQMHPALADTIAVQEGDVVRVVSRRGWAKAPARLTDAIRQDTVFMPFHWGGDGRANATTNPALDPVSGMPEFKSCAVRVERTSEETPEEALP